MKNFTRYLVVWILVISTVSTDLYSQIYVDVNATGSNNGTSWANAFTSLQDAIAAAASNDEIWVASGGYLPDIGTGQTNNARTSTFQLKDGVSIYGGFTSGQTNLDDRNPNPATNQTILSGDLDGDKSLSGNSYHVVSGSGLSSSAILDGFTITGGNADGIGSSAEGGGLYNYSGDPLILNCIFEGNRADIGGAVRSFYGTPHFTNCIFRGNSSSIVGGAVATEMYVMLHVIETRSSFPPIVFTNCIFSGNTSGHGGALHLASGPYDLINCSISGNVASGDGGGIYSGITHMSVFNSIIWNNKSDGQTTSPEASMAYSSVLGLPTKFYFSIVANSGGSGLGWDTSIGDDYGDNLDTDPLFEHDVNLSASFPNYTGNLRLTGCSPAINAGDNSYNSELSDVEGFGRIFEEDIDLGGYKYQDQFGTICECSWLHVDEASGESLWSDIETLYSLSGPVISNIEIYVEGALTFDVYRTFTNCNFLMGEKAELIIAENVSVVFLESNFTSCES